MTMSVSTSTAPETMQWLQNSRLALVEKQCAFMGQLVFLPYYIRFFAHGINTIRNLSWQ